MSLISTQLNEAQRRDWAKALTRRRLTQFERALADPELVSLKQELAKIDLMIADAEERAGRGESHLVWRTLNKLIGKLNDLLTAPEPDHDEARAKAAELAECTAWGVKQGEARAEVLELLELRRKVADTERKYEELHKVLIPAAQVALLFDDLFGAIEAVVPERAMQLSLLREVRARVDNAHQRKLRPITLPESYEITTEDAPAQEASDVPGSMGEEPTGEQAAPGTSTGVEQPGADGGV